MKPEIFLAKGSARLDVDVNAAGAPAVNRTEREPYGQDWAAREFVRRHADRFRYVHDADAWHRFDGKRWRVDSERHAELAIKAMFRDFRIQGAKQDDKDLEELGMKLYAQTVRNILFLARSEPGIGASYADFDVAETCAYLLNVRNGTLDLRTGTLQPHDPADMISKITPIIFDPEATCPRFDLFLEQVFQGDAAMIAYLWRVIGYVLTGSTREQCFWNLFGFGANGKGTLVGILLALLDEYGTATDIKTFTVTRFDRSAGEATPHLAALRGMRFVSAVEPRNSVTMDEGIVKQWTGGDPVSARKLQENQFVFLPECKIFVASNSKPAVKDTSEGYWRRVRMIEFSARFEGEGRDLELLPKLRTELPGILAHAVRACLEWQETGLTEPPAIQEATEVYRREEDIVGRWLADATIREPSAREPFAKLFADFENWCKVEGEQPGPRNEFAAALSRANFEARTIGGKAHRLGLRLRNGADHD
jgi:putative DNA primase/helicase